MALRDFSKPFSVEVDNNLPLGDTLYKNAFISAINQMGSTYVEGSEQHIKIAFSSPCTCTSTDTGCTPSIPNAYIKICKQIVDPVSVGESPQEAVSFVVLHELGHVWGKKEHALCNEHRIMSPSYGCLYKGQHLKYQLQDIEDICSAGKVIGGVCK
jgi:hypothetical protein